MKSIEPFGNDIAICFACDDNYAPYTAVAIYSILENCDKSRFYEFIILSRDINEQHKSYITEIVENSGCAFVHFYDTTEIHKSVEYDVGAHLTSETNYRLFILGDIFKNFRKVIYLDCDVIVKDDISGLFDTDLEGAPIGAVESLGTKHSLKNKNVVLYDGELIDLEKYIKEIVGIKHMETYFHTGVLLIDLEKSRTFCDDKLAIKILHSKNFLANDEEVYNILFDGKVKYLEYRWNYINFVDRYRTNGEDDFPEIDKSRFSIIHYMKEKPWKTQVPMDEYYHEYEERMVKEYGRHDYKWG